MKHRLPRQRSRPPAPRSRKKRDIGAMNAAELAALDVAALSVGELEQAMRAAVKLDARELAVAFAQAGVTEAVRRGDARPLPALRDRDHRGRPRPATRARAAELVEQGAKYDAEHNGGQRAIEYGLRKAQLFVKVKDADKAVAEFDALIAQHPDEGKFYTTAAEEMLRLKTGAKALYFAEKGLAKAARDEQPRPGRPLPGAARRREEGVKSHCRRMDIGPASKLRGVFRHLSSMSTGARTIGRK